MTIIKLSVLNLLDVWEPSRCRRADPCRLPFYPMALILVGGGWWRWPIALRVYCTWALTKASALALTLNTWLTPPLMLPDPSERSHPNLQLSACKWIIQGWMVTPGLNVLHDSLMSAEGVFKEKFQIILPGGARINSQHSSVTNKCEYAWPILACTGSERADGLPSFVHFTWGRGPCNTHHQSLPTRTHKKKKAQRRA